ncbi:MAG: Ig domain-containing protein, partial [Candidatus Acidiferrum sp.]
MIRSNRVGLLLIASALILSITGCGSGGGGGSNNKVAAPAITSSATASGAVGAAFSYQITASNSPTSFGATGLPAGLTVNTTSGLISGTPTAAGTSSVTVSATNSGGTGSGPLTLTVNAVQPVITSSATASGTVGAAFSYQITASNSPTSFGATGLPAGLTVNTTSGLISG